MLHKKGILIMQKSFFLGALLNILSAITMNGMHPEYRPINFSASNGAEQDALVEQAMTEYRLNNGVLKYSPLKNGSPYDQLEIEAQEASPLSHQQNPSTTPKNDRKSPEIWLNSPLKNATPLEVLAVKFPRTMNPVVTTDLPTVTLTAENLKKHTDMLSARTTDQMIPQEIEHEANSLQAQEQNEADWVSTQQEEDFIVIMSPQKIERKANRLQAQKQREARSVSNQQERDFIVIARLFEREKSSKKSRINIARQEQLKAYADLLDKELHDLRMKLQEEQRDLNPNEINGLPKELPLWLPSPDSTGQFNRETLEERN